MLVPPTSFSVGGVVFSAHSIAAPGNPPWLSLTFFWVSLEEPKKDTLFVKYIEHTNEQEMGPENGTPSFVLQLSIAFDIFSIL